MVGYAVSELQHHLNLKMIIETEKQLEHMGIKKDWLYHGECYMYDMNILYEEN